MSDMEIIKLVFGIMLSIETIVLFILAYKLSYKYLIQEKRCSSQTKGVVNRYTAASRGDGIFLPVVFYTVNGKEYKVVGPEYKMYKKTTKKSLTSKNAMEFEENDQIFTTKRTVNSVVSVYRNPMRELYPLHSEIDVYYDPNNPKLAYVLRYCNKKWTFYALFISALFVLVMDLLILFVLSLLITVPPYHKPEPLNFLTILLTTTRKIKLTRLLNSPIAVE